MKAAYCQQGEDDGTKHDDGGLRLRGGPGEASPEQGPIQLSEEVSLLNNWQEEPGGYTGVHGPSQVCRIRRVALDQCRPGDRGGFGA